jgi:hypothetical protein
MTHEIEFYMAPFSDKLTFLTTLDKSRLSTSLPEEKNPLEMWRCEDDKSV